MVCCVNACVGRQESVESRMALRINTFPYMNISLMRQTNFFFPPKLLLQYNPYSGHDYTNLQVESYYHS